MGILVFVVLVWLAGIVVPYLVLRERLKVQKQELRNLGNAVDNLSRQVVRLEQTLRHPESGKNIESIETHTGTQTIPQTISQISAPQPESPVLPNVKQVISQKNPPARNAVFTSGKAENLVGRNVLGFAASALVFIGLVFLGFLVYEHINDTIKIVLMFALSFLLTSVGFVLCERKLNTFTVILIGCGFGSVFISVLLTHIYFGRLSDIAAFALLLCWMAFALAGARRYTSVTLSVVAHVGMAVSVFAAYGYGLSAEKLLLIFGYQIASIVLIVVGNILCCRKTYRFGVLISLLLTVITGCFMWSELNIPDATVTAIFLLEFAGASFLSYLLTVSANRLESDLIALLVQAAGRILWSAALFLFIQGLVYNLMLDKVFADVPDRLEKVFFSMLPAVLCSFSVVAAHMALTVWMRLRLGLKKQIESVSVLVLSATVFLLLKLLWTAQNDARLIFPCLPYTIAVAALLILSGRISRNKLHYAAAQAFLVTDAVLVLLTGYSDMNAYGTAAFSLCYMLLYPLLSYLQWRVLEAEDRIKYIGALKIAAYVIVQLSLSVILTDADFAYGTTILLLVMTAAHIVLQALSFDGNSKVLRRVLQAGALFWTAVSALYISFDDKDATESVLYFALLILSSVLAFMRMRKALAEGRTGTQILCGIKLTALPLAFVNGYTEWFAEAYAFSLLSMLAGLLCVATGFACKARVLRLYGLYLTLFCVLKMVTYDVAGLDAVLRVVSLIGGGVICFAISALYSYSVKKTQF